MRRVKVIKIDDREITIWELRVKDIRKIFASEDQNTTLMDHLPMVTSLTVEDIDEMSPSEIHTVWDAVKEVNADFLELLTRTKIMEYIEKTAMRILMQPFAALSSPDMSTSGITDTDFSFAPQD